MFPGEGNCKTKPQILLTLWNRYSNILPKCGHRNIRRRHLFGRTFFRVQSRERASRAKRGHKLGNKTAKCRFHLCRYVVKPEIRLFPVRIPCGCLLSVPRNLLSFFSRDFQLFEGFSDRFAAALKMYPDFFQKIIGVFVNILY